MSIRVFDRDNASDSEWLALHSFTNTLTAENWPDDPAAPLAVTQGRVRHAPAFANIKRWLLWEGDQVVAVALVETWNVQDNQHLAEAEIEVHPDWRRQGIARRLLPLIVDEARARNRRLLLTWVNDESQAAREFLTHLGGKRSLETHTNQLVLAEVDRDLLRTWQERARERAADFELGCWEDRYPEESMEQVLALSNAMNDAPRGELDVEDERPTAEEIRQWEAALRARGDSRWTAYVRHIPSGELAGFSEVFYSLHRPWVLQQAATAVLPKYRGAGLGRWLKAAMLEKVLRERPGVQFVRTGNADANAPMLKINYELGFRPYKSWAAWQTEVASAAAYLAARAEPVPVPA